MGNAPGILLYVLRQWVRLESRRTHFLVGFVDFTIIGMGAIGGAGVGMTCHPLNRRRSVILPHPLNWWTMCCNGHPLSTVIGLAVDDARHCVEATL